MESSDPLHSWPLNEVLRKAIPAKNDIYGGLYFHVRNMLERFCRRVLDHGAVLHLTMLDSTSLSQLLKSYCRNSFDRIEVGPHHCVIFQFWSLGTDFPGIRPVQ